MMLVFGSKINIYVPNVQRQGFLFGYCHNLLFGWSIASKKGQYNRSKMSDTLVMTYSDITDEMVDEQVVRYIR